MQLTVNARLDPYLQFYNCKYGFQRVLIYLFAGSKLSQQTWLLSPP